MSVKLRFQRVGKKKQPFYRLVAIDSRKRRDGKPLEVIGNFNPRAETQGDELIYNYDRFTYWLSNGAQVSDRVRTALKRKGAWGKLVESIRT